MTTLRLEGDRGLSTDELVDVTQRPEHSLRSLGSRMFNGFMDVVDFVTEPITYHVVTPASLEDRRVAGRNDLVPKGLNEKGFFDPVSGESDEKELFDWVA